jgi:hypothetical protein
MRLKWHKDLIACKRKLPYSNKERAVTALEKKLENIRSRQTESRTIPLYNMWSMAFGKTKKYKREMIICTLTD